jgi:hypothetical protein
VRYGPAEQKTWLGRPAVLSSRVGRARMAGRSRRVLRRDSKRPAMCPRLIARRWRRQQIARTAPVQPHATPHSRPRRPPILMPLPTQPVGADLAVVSMHGHGHPGAHARCTSTTPGWLTGLILCRKSFKSAAPPLASDSPIDKTRSRVHASVLSTLDLEMRHAMPACALPARTYRGEGRGWNPWTKTDSGHSPGCNGSMELWKLHISAAPAYIHTVRIHGADMLHDCFVVSGGRIIKPGSSSMCSNSCGCRLGSARPSRRTSWVPARPAPGTAPCPHRILINVQCTAQPRVHAATACVASGGAGADRVTRASVFPCAAAACGLEAGDASLYSYSVTLRAQGAGTNSAPRMRSHFAAWKLEGQAGCCHANGGCTVLPVYLRGCLLFLSAPVPALHRCTVPNILLRWFSRH